jgi:hypothetical protein
LKEALAALVFGAGLCSDPTMRGRRLPIRLPLASLLIGSDPTMRGRLNSGFWVVGHGSSTKFGKVTVTDAELTLTKKRRCSALTLGIGNAAAGL